MDQTETKASDMNENTVLLLLALNNMLIGFMSCDHTQLHSIGCDCIVITYMNNDWLGGSCDHSVKHE